MAKKGKRAKAPGIIKRAAAKPGQSVAMDYFSNYAALDSAYGSAMHNITTSPTLNNAAGGQFWQTVGSSDIASGTALGAPYNIGIQPGSSLALQRLYDAEHEQRFGSIPLYGERDRLRNGQRDAGQRHYALTPPLGVGGRNGTSKGEHGRLSTCTCFYAQARGRIG